MRAVFTGLTAIRTMIGTRSTHRSGKWQLLVNPVVRLFDLRYEHLVDISQETIEQVADPVVQGEP